MQSYIIFGFSHHLGLLLSNTDLVSLSKGFSLDLECNNMSTIRTSKSSGIMNLCTVLGLREPSLSASGEKELRLVLVLPSTIISKQHHDFSMDFLESSEGGDLLWWSISLSQRPGFSALFVTEFSHGWIFGFCWLVFRWHEGPPSRLLLELRCF